MRPGEENGEWKSMLVDAYMKISFGLRENEPKEIMIWKELGMSMSADELKKYQNQEESLTLNDNYKEQECK